MRRRVSVGHANSLQDSSIAISDSGECYAEALERPTQSKKATAIVSLHYAWRSIDETLGRLGLSPVRDAEVTFLDTWDPVRFHQILGDPELRTLLTEKGFGRFAAGTLQLATLELEPMFRTQLAWWIREGRCRVTTYPTGDLEVAGAAPDPGITWETRTLDHHLAHAATAVYTSPFDECMVLVADGFGEGHATSVYHFADGELRLLHRISIQTSLGLLFYRITYLCGFDPAEGEEWKVMGLAAYGRERPEIRKFFATRAQAYHGGAGGPLTESDFEDLVNLLGGIRRHSDPDVLQAADLARNFQDYFEDAVIQLARHAEGYGLSRNFAYTGGCALNSAANGRILAETGFERLHVPSAPGDDGNSLGAVLYHRHKILGEPRRPGIGSPYLGRAVDDGRGLEELLATTGLPHRRIAEEGELCRETARLLADGRIVGWMQGRAELGPRALGNRSILADPRDEGMRDRINATVKFREGFRPLAPAILHEHGPEYFEDYQESPYMERTLRFREAMRERAPAVVHRDGTGRLQSVKREWNPLFHRLLQSFYELTGVPILLNTSLNVQGRPIAHSEQDALSVLVFTALDVLVIGSYVIGV